MMIGTAGPTRRGTFVLRVEKTLACGCGPARVISTDVVVCLAPGVPAPREGAEVIVEGALRLNMPGSYAIVADRVQEER